MFGATMAVPRFRRLPSQWRLVRLTLLGRGWPQVTDQSVVYAPCDHVYHAKCLGHWAALKKSEALQAQDRLEG